MDFIIWDKLKKMKKVKIKIDLDKITKKVIKEHQMLKGELKRIEKLNEGIEYDPNHPERMNPSLEDKLRSGEHTFGKNKGLPATGTNQNYSERRKTEWQREDSREQGVESREHREQIAELTAVDGGC